LGFGRITEEFGSEVGAAINALTERDGEGYDAYLIRVEASPIAAKVKLAELTDNSDIA
jgi:hypothetical protein